MDKLGGSWASVITCCISVIFEDLEMDGCVFFPQWVDKLMDWNDFRGRVTF